MNTVNPQRALLLSMGLLLLASARLSAVDFSMRSIGGDTGPIIAGTGQNVAIDVVISNDSADADGAIQGFQLAISHDAQYLSFVSITWARTALAALPLNGGNGPDFYLVNEDPAGGGGITLGVVFQEQALLFVLGPGDHVVSRARYDAVATTGETPSMVEFAASLGDPAIENKYTTRAGETLAPASTSGIAVAVSDVAYSIHFGAASYEVEAGQDVTVPILLQNSPQPVSGFSFGVRHPSANLTFKELRTGADLAAIVGDLGNPTFEEDSPFFALNTEPEGGGGFTVALILNSSDGSKVLDPLLSPHTIFEAVYTAGANASAPIEITGELGSPAVGIVLDLAGSSQPPLLPTPPPPTTSVIEIGGGGVGVPFSRGDVDQGGSRNITDAISILNFLFSIDAVINPGVLATIDRCKEAMDTNGDQSVNLTDTVYLLNFQFRNGPRPPAPFPDCGLPDSSAPPAIKCLEFAGCN